MRGRFRRRRSRSVFRGMPERQELANKHKQNIHMSGVR